MGTCSNYRTRQFTKIICDWNCMLAGTEAEQASSSSRHCHRYFSKGTVQQCKNWGNSWQHRIPEHGYMFSTKNTSNHVYKQELMMEVTISWTPILRKLSRQSLSLTTGEPLNQKFYNISFDDTCIWMHSDVSPYTCLWIQLFQLANFDWLVIQGKENG